MRNFKCAGNLKLFNPFIPIFPSVEISDSYIFPIFLACILSIFNRTAKYLISCICLYTSEALLNLQQISSSL